MSQSWTHRRVQASILRLGVRTLIRRGLDEPTFLCDPFKVLDRPGENLAIEGPSIDRLLYQDGESVKGIYINVYSPTDAHVNINPFTSYDKSESFPYADPDFLQKLLHFVEDGLTAWQFEWERFKAAHREIV